MTPRLTITLLRTQTDARLVRLAAAGHDTAFEAVVERYRTPLLRYARGLGLGAHGSEDVVQASFVAAWAAIGDGVAVRELRPWLYRIVHNRSLNAVRAARGDDAPLIEVLDARPGPAADVESRDEVRRVFDGIASLPARQREALVAVAIDGRAHADVGAELGVSDTAVRQLVRRARGTLRAAATAITPLPVANWLAQSAVQGGDQPARIAELVAAGGSAGAAGAALKAGAVALTVGAVATGAPHLARTERPARELGPATAQAKHEPAPPAPTTAMTPVRQGAAMPAAAQTGHGAAEQRGRGEDALALSGRAEEPNAGPRRRRHRRADDDPLNLTAPLDGDAELELRLDGHFEGGDGGGDFVLSTTGELASGAQIEPPPPSESPGPGEDGGEHGSDAGAPAP